MRLKVNKSFKKLLKDNDYYYQTSIQEYAYQHTDIITGDLDLLSLKDEDPECWLIQVAEQKWKKKKVIITDLSSRFRLYRSAEQQTKNNFNYINNHTNYMHELEFSFWNHLLELGFEIYAWTGELCLIKNSAD